MALDVFVAVVLMGWLLLAGMLVFGVRRGVRRISSVVRTSPARLAVERRALRLRAGTMPPGSVRQILQLRSSLHDNLTHTELVIAQRAGSATILDELLRDLRANAAQLQRGLRSAQYEPDEAFRSEAVSTLSRRVQHFNDNALSLRRSAMELAGDPALLEIEERELRDRIEGLAAAIQDLKTKGPSLPGPPTT